MSSIPFDPTLNIGQIVHLQKIKDLMELAEIQKKVDNALDKMNNTIRMYYSIKMLKEEMENIGASKKKLEQMQKKIDKVKEASAEAAMDYADAFLKTEDEMNKAKERQGQKTMAMVPESPMDYQLSTVSSFPLSFDSLKFDVQYVRNEEQKDSTYSHAASVSISASLSISTMGADDGMTPSTSSTVGASMTNDSSLLQQCTQHNIEGTIVITAYTTHKNACIIDPFVLDPDKALSAWNQTYPDDPITVDPVGIMKAALGDAKKSVSKRKTLNILSGCSKASSFVGFVHILQQEFSTSEQSASSTTMSIFAQTKSKVEAAAAINSVSGSVGASISATSMAKEMNSTSTIQNHANLVCYGVIPSIVSSDVVTTVKSLKPDAQQTMSDMAALSESSNSAMNNNMDSMATDNNAGCGYLSVNSSFLENSVAAIGEIQSENNKVIDVNSMFNAFTDYVEKVTQGDAGVPINFYIKKITKSDIAKCYIRKYYPNGASNPKDARAGMLGQTSSTGDQ